MSIIWTILIGFVVGLVAKVLAPGKGPGGFFLTAALGVGGSLFATFAGQTLGWYQQGQTAGFISATIGAIILLVLYSLISKKS